jgi:hypothetical protein
MLQRRWMLERDDDNDVLHSISESWEEARAIMQLEEKRKACCTDRMDAKKGS